MYMGKNSLKVFKNIDLIEDDQRHKANVVE